jgi:hypothetical protein
LVPDQQQQMAGTIAVSEPVSSNYVCLTREWRRGVAGSKQLDNRIEDSQEGGHVRLGVEADVKPRHVRLVPEPVTPQSATLPQSSLRLNRTTYSLV